jgi:hypothetical protein
LKQVSVQEALARLLVERGFYRRAILRDGEGGGQEDECKRRKSIYLPISEG